MADQKISALNELTTWATDDEIAIVDTDIAETKRMTGANVKANVMLGFINLEPTAQTIDAAGAITVTSSYVTVDTFGGAATDNLDDINGGSIGDILILRQANNARDVTVRDVAVAGNVHLDGGVAFAFVNIRARLMLIKDTGTSWTEISRSQN
jgi:hypothetical protein